MSPASTLTLSPDVVQPARDALARFLREAHDVLLEQLEHHLETAPGIEEAQRVAELANYKRGMATLLRLLAANAADPRNQRVFSFTRHYARGHLRHAVPAREMLRLASLYRQITVPMLQERFSGDPGISAMSRIIDEQQGELKEVLADAYQAERDRQWQSSESKYFWLFENASEAIISFRPIEGRIIEANAQAECLTGYERAELLGISMMDLFAPEHREQLEWLVSRPVNHETVRIEDLSIRRGTSEPVCDRPGEDKPAEISSSENPTRVSLSCTWLQVDDDVVAQVILRDMTGQWQAQRQLRSHAEQLEARVRERTVQLQASEERFRSLFLQEQRRARHLSLINEVQKCALATRDLETFLPQVTRAIHSHFADCDVAFYLAEADRYGLSMLWPAPEETGGDLTLVACAGQNGLCPAIGARYSLQRMQMEGGQGAFHPEAQSYLSVPVVIENETVGLISVQARQPDVLDARDVAALQTAAAIIASHLQSSRLFRNMRELNDFNQSLLNSMLHSLIVVDNKGRIQFINERFCQVVGHTREELLKSPLNTVLHDGALRHYRLMEAAQEVMNTGEPQEVPEVHLWFPDGQLIFDIRMFRVFFRGEAEAAMLMINLTQRWRKTYQLQTMHEIGRLFQESLDIDRVLSAVLTCITAGSALGFNRAFVFLHDDTRNEFTGAMALGPSSREEAGHIWSEISQHELTLPEILKQVEARYQEAPSPLQLQVMSLQLDASNPCFPALRRALEEKRALVAGRDEFLAVARDSSMEQQEECRLAGQLFTAMQVAIAPLMAKEKLVGIVIADNLYSGSAIDADDVQLLDTLAQQAGLTIDNALTYQALQKAQKELVSAERLVAVGEMAARVSHEIRNPLATIGGFARSVLKKPDDAESVTRKTTVVVNEIARLEELLTDLLDMARPRPLNILPNSLNEMLDHALLLADSEIKASGATVVRELQPDMPLVPCDRGRLLQALLNTIRNGVQAMPDGGTLKVATRVAQRGPTAPAFAEIEISDTGHGISERALKQVFDPFFSTKVSGSGLGLAVTKKILQDHGGQIDVFSQEGEGTTFIFTLPLPAKAMEQKAN
jgi:hypothetical protein